MNIINLIKKPFYYKIDNKVLHVQCDICHFSPVNHIENQLICKLKNIYRGGNLL